MAGHRALALTLAALAVLSLVAGTGGFDAATADRPVRVAVAEDSDASLGLAQGCTDGEPTLTVTDRFPTALAVTVAWSSNGSRTSETVALTPGGSATVVLNGTEDGDAVAVEAVGDGVTVAANRTVTVDCGAS